MTGETSQSQEELSYQPRPSKPLKKAEETLPPPEESSATKMIAPSLVTLN